MNHNCFGIALCCVDMILYYNAFILEIHKSIDKLHNYFFLPYYAHHFSSLIYLIVIPKQFVLKKKMQHR